MNSLKYFVSNWGFVFLSALLDSYAAFVVKSQFNKLGVLNFKSIKSIFNYLQVFIKDFYLLTGLLAFALAPAMWFIALNKIELSVAYPVLVGFHLVFVLFFGVNFLNEPMNINKIIGSLLILLSLFFFYKK
jgi:multidrug transporter EmrE-like cation transporter